MIRIMTTTLMLLASVTLFARANPEFIDTPIPSATQGISFEYNITASDADGDFLTVSATNLPSWLSWQSEDNATISTIATDSEEIFGVAVTSSGVIYYSVHDTNSLWKIDTNGTTTKVLDETTLSEPSYLAVDNNDNIIISEFYNNRIVRYNTTTESVDLNYTITLGTRDYFRKNSPSPVRVGSDDKIYFALPYDYTIWRIDPDGSNPTKVAGIANSAGVTNPSVDGTDATSAYIGVVRGLAFDSSGQLYFAEEQGRVVKIDNNGKVQTIVTGLIQLRSIEFDKDNNLFITAKDSHIIYKWDGSSTTTYIGDGTNASTGDGGPKSNAQISYPIGLTLDLVGNIYFSEFLAPGKLSKITRVALVGTPTNSDVGTYDFNLTVSDGTETVEKEVSTTVVNVNDAPTASDISVTIDEDTNKTFGMAEASAINFQDVDGDSLDAMYITALPSKGTLKLSGIDVELNEKLLPAQIGSLVFTPVTDEHGIPYTTFGFKVSDGEDNSTEQTVIVNVTSVNDASPTITSTAVSSVDEDSVYSYTLEASDADGDKLTWKITDGRNLPDWLGLSNESNFTTATNPLDSATIRLYSIAAFVDIDNDGDLDFFFGENDGSMHYYKNTGSNSVAVFEVQTGTNDPLDGVDVGSNSAPAFVDIDNDGDFDVFIGEYSGNINYFKNTGSNTTPVFEEQTGALNPLDGLFMGNFTKPTFADIDNDGDMDLFVGEKNGIVHYYKNTGSNTVAVFEEQTGALNPLDGVDIGIKSVPSFVDIDEDGDLDLFIGAEDGNIYHYKNTGSNTVAVFEEQTGVDNPLDSLDVGGHSGPVFVDIDNDHDMDLFITQDNGANGIVYYKNDSSTLLSGVTTNADVGQYDINLTLSDGIDTVEYNFQITVNNVNDAPTFNIDGLEFEENTFNDTLNITSTDWIHEGGDSYRSKDITHDESSSHIIEINPNRDANISFDWTVSSEWDYDFLEYYVDGVQLFLKSGEEHGTYIHTLSAGTHTLEWKYIKDYIESAGSDDANISNITLTNVGGAIINYDKVLISQEENIASVVDIDGEDIDVGDVLAYNISGTDASLFNIDSTTGEITFINAPDYNNPVDSNSDNVYELNVSISDLSGASVSKELFVTVTDVDDTPDTFSFTSQTNKTISASYESNTVTITGIDDGVSISVSGGEYKINSGAYTTTAGTINNDDNVTLRQTSSGSYSTTTTTSLTVGSVTSDFKVTTSSAPSSGGGYTPPTTEPEEPVVEPEPEPEEPVVEPEPEPEEPVVEPEPEQEAPSIFDEDRTSPDMDVGVINDDNSQEEVVVINKIETNKEVTVVESSDDSDGDPTNKEFSLTLTDTTTGESISKTIVVENETATSSTTELGSKITSEVSDIEKEVKTEVEINSNGTSAVTVTTKDNTSGEQSSSGLISLSPTSDTKVQKDGSVLLSDETDGVKNEASATSDGKTMHKVTFQNENGEEIQTEATSEAKGSVVILLGDGTVQTKAKVKQDDDSEVIVAVDGKPDGKAVHILKVKDSNGKETVTKATSNIPSAKTIINKEGEVETKVSTTNSDIVVSANKKGQATHKVTVGGVTTSVTSEVSGAQTVIGSEGSVETTANVIKIDGNGAQFIIRAKVFTHADGTSTSGFERVNVTTGEVEEVDNTLAEGSSFEEGNSAIIKETTDGDINFQIDTQITKTLVIE